MNRTIEKTVEYPYPRELVWRALTDPRALTQWLMATDFEPTVGHEFTFQDKPAPGWDGVVHCEVLELDEPSKMVWKWVGGPLDTIVTFELESTSTGTKLHFLHEGFDGLRPVLVSFILDLGFHKMYRKLLPVILAEMAEERWQADTSRDEFLRRRAT